MSDRLDPISDPSPEEVAAVEALLARAGADVDLWSELPTDLEALVVAAIADESTSASTGSTTGSTTGSSVASIGDTPVRSLDGVRRARSGRRELGVPWWLGAAAALALVVTGIVLVTRSGDDDADDAEGDDAVEFALAGTDTAPDATAEVIMSSTPAGLKILLDADGLPGAPDGSYYEAWLSDGDVRVSAGTFHLRGGSNQIELWAGVVGPQFDTLSVTLEPVDADNGSSGDVVLRGTVDG
jgi:hypothetical protein